MKITQPRLESLHIYEFLRGINPTCRLLDLQAGVRIYIPRVDDYATVIRKNYRSSGLSRRCISIEALSDTKCNGIDMTYVLTVEEARRCYIEKAN